MRPALRDYQEEAVNALRLNFASGLKRQVLIAATGAGKSVMAHDIVARAREKNKRVLFVVNRIQLVNQFSQRLTAANIPHGIIRGEDTRMPYLPVVVGSVQTIARRGIGNFDVIVIDEAHAVPGSKDYRTLIAAHPDAAILGLTATPWAKGMAKADYDGISGPLFQAPVLAAPISKLVEEGHLVDCDVWAPTTVDMTGAKKVKNPFGDMDYSDVAAAERMDKPQLVGDIVTQWKRIAPGSNTVIFASSIEHSQHIVSEFQRAGYAAEHISAYTPLEEREAIFARHKRGETLILSCVALLREGWDAPECSTLILARPTRSLIAYIQMAGRVLRPAPGKDKAIIIDHTGTVAKLGFPTEDRDMTLDDGKPKPAGETEAEKKELKPCPKCGYVDHYKGLCSNDRSCPNCGFVPERKPKDVAHTDDDLHQIKKGASKDDKQRVYSELLALANERGRSSGWVAHKYRAKFGVWPRGLMEEPIQPSPETRSWVRSQDIRYAKAQEKLRGSNAPSIGRPLPVRS
jgi:superfamily II DNA or RNA helicase